MARDYKPLESKFHRIRNSFRSVVRRSSKHKSSNSGDSGTPSATAKAFGSTSSNSSNIGRRSHKSSKDASRSSFFGKVNV